MIIKKATIRIYYPDKNFHSLPTERVTAVCEEQTKLGKVVSRTAIEAEILFAVCVIEKQALTGGKSLACEDKCSKSIGAASKQARC